MTIKCIPAGDLIDYVQSAKDYKQRDRPYEPKWIGPGPRLTEELLDCMMPPHVKTKKKQRWVGHCRRHLNHLIVGFSEGFEQIAPYRQLVLRTTESLLAAGMGLDSLKFLWCEHPLLEHSHFHCGLLRSCLPFGGAYVPRLSSALAIDFSWLISRRLGFSQPTAFGRLIRAGEFSYKHDNRSRIDEICRVTLAEFDAKQLLKHDHFIALLKDRQLGEVLAVPDPEGWPCAQTSGSFGRGYRHCVAIRGNNDSVIWLAGAVCRTTYDYDALEQKRQQRQDLFKDESIVFDRFMRRLKDRIESQSAAYLGYQGQTKVMSQAFEWLNPEHDSLLCLSRDTMKVSDQMVANSIQLPKIEKSRATFIWDDSSMPESAYPYYSDLEQEELDITDPQAWFTDGLDEPLEQNGWMPFWLNLPNLSADEAADDDPGGGNDSDQDDGKLQDPRESSAGSEAAPVEINQEGKETYNQPSVPKGAASGPQPAGLIVPAPGPDIAVSSGTTQADDACNPAPAAEEKEIVPIPSGQAPDQPGIGPAPAQDDGKLEGSPQTPAGSEVVAVEINQEGRGTDHQPSVPEGADPGPQPERLIAPDPGPDIARGLSSGTTQADDASNPAPAAAEEKEIVPIPSGQAPDEPGIIPTPTPDGGRPEESPKIPAGPEVVAVEINQEGRGTDHQPFVPEGADPGPQPERLIAPDPGPVIPMGLGSGKPPADDASSPDPAPKTKEAIPAQVISPPVDPKAKERERIEALKPEKGKIGKLFQIIAKASIWFLGELPKDPKPKIAPQPGQPSTAIKPKPPEPPVITTNQPKLQVVTTNQPELPVTTTKRLESSFRPPNQAKSPVAPSR